MYKVTTGNSKRAKSTEPTSKKLTLVMDSAQNIKGEITSIDGNLVEIKSDRDQKILVLTKDQLSRDSHFKVSEMGEFTSSTFENSLYEKLKPRLTLELHYTKEDLIPNSSKNCVSSACKLKPADLRINRLKNLLHKMGIKCKTLRIDELNKNSKYSPYISYREQINNSLSEAEIKKFIAKTYLYHSKKKQLATK